MNVKKCWVFRFRLWVSMNIKASLSFSNHLSILMFLKTHVLLLYLFLSIFAFDHWFGMRSAVHYCFGVKDTNNIFFGLFL